MNNPLTLIAFCTGITALAKKAGLSGDWLIIPCVLAGAIYTYLLTYQPALLESLSGIFLALTATGNVSLAKDLLPQVGAQPGNGGGAA